MNVIHLCGGIGNQIFQYAFGRVHQERGVVVRFNPSWYKRTQSPPRPYRLNKFNTNISISPFIRQQLINEAGFDSSYLRIDNANFHGYWQYLPYYVGIIPLLKKELYVREEFYTKDFLDFRNEITNNSSVSLHVRRQDYVNRNGFGCLPIKYYHDALAMTEGDVYIFSDDIEWCKCHFNKDILSRKLTYINLHDYLDFELMRLCKHHILANSTFSWWAAILDDNGSNTIITPARWLRSTKAIDAREIKLHYPEHWIKLK